MKPNRPEERSVTQDESALDRDRISDQQKQILRHALGLKQGNTAYRNHFVTGEGCRDYSDCIALVDAGMMVKRDGNALTGGDDLFMVTDTGKAMAEQESEG